MLSHLRLTVVFVALLVSCGPGIAFGQFGLERLPSADGICSDLMFVCYTCGLGTAEFTISETLIFRSHATYPEETPDEAVVSRLGGDFNATNFFESELDSNETCDDNSTMIYRTELIVRVANRTLCQLLMCDVELSGTRTQFGNRSIQWLYPPPTNLKVVNRLMNSTTVSWASGAADCSNITYEVTSNCGNCSSSIDTTDTSITCGSLVADEECNVTVRSILDCEGYSEPRMVTVWPYILNVSVETTPGHVPVSTTLAIGTGVGLGVGLLFGIPVLLVTALWVVPGLLLLAVFYCKNRQKRNVSTTAAASLGDANDSAVVNTSEDIPLVHIPTPKTENPKGCVESPKEHESKEEAAATPAPAPSEPPQHMVEPTDSKRNTSQLRLLAHDVLARESPKKSEATGNSTAVSGAPRYSEETQESPKKLKLKEEDASTSDVSDLPRAQTSPKKLKLSGENSAAADALQHSKQAQESTEKVDPEAVVATNTGASSQPSSPPPPASQKGPDAAGAGSDAGEVSQEVQSTKKDGKHELITGSHQGPYGHHMSNGLYNVREKSPPKSQIADSRGMPSQLQDFGATTEPLQRESDGSLVKHSVGDIPGNNNKMALDMHAVQELGSNRGVSEQPAAQGLTDSSGGEGPVPKSPIPQSDNGAGGSRHVATFPTSEVTRCSPENDRITGLEMRVSTNEREIKDLKTEVHKAQMERNQACVEVFRLSQKLEKLNTLYNELEKKYEAEKSIHQELKNRHASLEKSEAKNKECTLERKRLRKENKDMKKEKEDLERENEEMRRKKEEWEMEKEAMERKMQEMATKNEELKSKLMEAEIKMQETENEKRKLQRTIEVTKEELMKAKAQLQAIENGHQEPESGN